MKTPIRRYHLALLFSLLALFGVSISAQRIWETLPASFKEKMHSTRRATDPSASPGIQATNTSAEPAQANLAIPQNVLPGGGGTSAGGTLTLDGTIGQGLAGGAMTGGSLSASSGFWGGAAAAQCPTITVNNPQDPSGVIGTALSRTFTQTGGAGTVMFSLNSGALPTGVTLATDGKLSGTPMQFGNFPITVKATDSNNCSGTGATYTLVVSCQSLSVFNPAVTTAMVGTPFSQNFTHTGGLGTVTFTTNNSALPPGLTLNPNGMLSGTPTQAGSFTFTVSIADGNNCGVSGLPYTLVVSPGTTTARVIRAAGASGNPGGVVVVPIELVSQGDENAISFSLTFDPSVLSNPQVALGSDANGASQNVNISQVASGRLGLIVALPSGQSFSAGTRRIFAVT
ncbi:MAG: putative Ig domain-containing protein, partial [Acidobacteria bacterium]|nr:putative Ig domain-containing protein [Acidobacteriota bacterium]